MDKYALIQAIHCCSGKHKDEHPRQFQLLVPLWGFLFGLPPCSMMLSLTCFSIQMVRVGSCAVLPVSTCLPQGLWDFFWLYYIKYTQVCQIVLRKTYEKHNEIICLWVSQCLIIEKKGFVLLRKLSLAPKAPHSNRRSSGKRWNICTV